MAKYCGKIGYAVSEETSPGVWEEKITEREYYGELIKNTRKLASGENLNDDITVANDVSIVADPVCHGAFLSNTLCRALQRQMESKRCRSQKSATDSQTGRRV